MRVLLLCVLACLRLAGQISYVQSNVGASVFTTTATATLPSVTAGTVLIAYGLVGTTGAYTNFTLSDSVNGSWGGTNCVAIALAGTRQAKACWFPNSAASAGTYTLTETPTGGSGNAGMNIAVHNYSGVATVSPTDGTQPSSLTYTTSASSWLCPSITTTNAKDVVFAWMVNNGSPNWTINGSFTARGSVTAQQLVGADNITSSTGTFQPTWTASAAETSAIAGMLALKAAPVVTTVSPSVIYELALDKQLRKSFPMYQGPHLKIVGAK